MPSYDLRHRTALVTGASSGIGKAIAEVLARDVATLVLVARRKERLDDLAAELIAARPELKVIVRAVDLVDRRAVAAMIDELEKDGLEIDVLVNNAGFGDRAPLGARPWPKLDSLLELNVVTATYLLHRLVPEMIARGSGAVLNVGSIAGVLPKPGSAVYGASKGYLNTLSDALHSELAGTGVHVTVLLPGPVPTEFGALAGQDDASPVGHGVGPRASTLQWLNLFRTTARDNAEIAVRAMIENRARVFPSVAVRALATALDLAPRFALRAALGSFARRARKG